VSVTQRLKKFSTILDKLSRYPTMRLTAMEDIGGVRAILPTQAAADSRHLRIDYKSGRGHDAVHAYYVGISELLAMMEASTVPSDAFSAELRRRYMLAEPFLASQHDEEQP
jgi:hypothetical protein